MTLAILPAIAAAVVILACAVYLLYKRDMNAARAPDRGRAPRHLDAMGYGRAAIRHVGTAKDRPDDDDAPGGGGPEALRDVRG